MPTLGFTATLKRHVEAPEATLEGETVRQVLDSYFAQHPAVRSYVLDDQGAVRHHVAIFLNCCSVRDRRNLSDPVAPDDGILVVQALSGG